MDHKVQCPEARSQSMAAVSGALVIPAVCQAIWTSLGLTSWLIAWQFPTYWTSVVFVIFGFGFIAYRFRWWSLALAIPYLPAMYFLLWGISMTIREFKSGELF